MSLIASILQLLRDCVERGDNLLALRGASGATNLNTVAIEEDRGRGRADIELAHEFEVGFGIDMDVLHIVHRHHHLREQGMGRLARGAECR